MCWQVILSADPEESLAMPVVSEEVKDKAVLLLRLVDLPFAPNRRSQEGDDRLVHLFDRGYLDREGTLSHVFAFAVLVYGWCAALSLRHHLSLTRNLTTAKCHCTFSMNQKFGACVTPV